MTAMCLIVMREPEPVRLSVTVVEELHPVASVMLPARPGATAPTVTAGALPAPVYDRLTVTWLALAILNPVTVTLATLLEAVKLVPEPYLVQLPFPGCPPQGLGP